MRKRTVVLISIIAILSASAFGLIRWQLPKAEALAKYYIDSISENEKVPIALSAEGIQLALFPPKLILKNISISPKKSIEKIIKPFIIEKIEIVPSLIDLAIGKFWVSSILIKNSEVEINIPPPDNRRSKDFDFISILKLIPISELQLQGIKVKARYQNKYTFTTDSLFIRAYNQKNSLLAKVKEPSLKIQKIGSKENIEFLIDTQFMITKSSLSLSKLKVIKGKSFFIASGNLNYDGKLSNIRELRMNTRFKGTFAKIDEWTNYFQKNDHLKLFNGEAKVDINLYKKADQDIIAEASGGIEKFQIEDIILGDIQFKGKIKNKSKVQFSSLSLDMVGGGKALITNLILSKDEKVTINAEVQVKDVQLQTFLKESTIADIPVWIKIKGKLSCKGELHKKFQIKCPGVVTAKNLIIKNEQRSKTIVSLKEANAEGSLTISGKDIRYQAKVKTQHSKGSSKGVINYKTGFKIDYDSPRFDLADIQEIAELKFSGAAPLSGQTVGNSDTATFFIDFKAENFEFADYYFGNLNSMLKYKKSVLYFEKLNGSIESTRYNGYLNVDLSKERITGDIALPFFRMIDIQQSVIKKVDLKNRFLGSGSGKASIDTSFDTDKLSFDFKGRLFKGTVFGESFDEAKVHFKSVDGLVTLKNNRLFKEKTIFSITGTMDMELNTNFSFTIFEGNLQNSLLLKNLSVPISGLFIAKGEITEKINSPKITLNANLDDFIFNKKKYGAATFNYQSDQAKDIISFNLPQQLKLLAKIPQDGSPNYFIDLETNKLDIAPIIAFAIAENSTRSYIIESSGQASGTINFTDPWNSEFSAILKELVIDYKSNRIASQLPTSIELKNKKLFLNEINMKGVKQFLKVTQPHSKPYETDFIINGRINISFFKIFAPFIERIDGFSTIHLELNLKKNDFKLIGSSYTSDSYILFPKFPHAFENVTADVLFNQNKLMINSIKGRFADGTALGNGEIIFRGPKDYDLSINLNFEKINVRFPEGFSTYGDARMSFTGSGVPFELKGRYDIEKGFIEKDFESQASENSSNLLAELLRKDETSPILLDIDVNATQGVQVKNTLVDGEIAGNFKVYDKVDAPRIKGSARFLRNSKIKFRDTEFDVTDSNIQFMGHTPLNPNIFLNAKTRLHNYDIAMLLQGSASNTKLNFSSQPSLPEQKIISLLAFGVANDNLDDDLNSEQSNLQIGTSLLGNNPLGRELKDRTGFDIQFSSSFDSGSNVAVPRVVLSRKISKKMEASFSQKTGNTPQQEARLRYELDNQLSAIFSLKTKQQNALTENSQINNDETDQLGVDLEYKLEFD